MNSTQLNMVVQGGNVVAAPNSQANSQANAQAAGSAALGENSFSKVLAEKAFKTVAPSTTSKQSKSNLTAEQLSQAAAMLGAGSENMGMMLMGNTPTDLASELFGMGTNANESKGSAATEGLIEALGGNTGQSGSLLNMGGAFDISSLATLANLGVLGNDTSKLANLINQTNIANLGSPAGGNQSGTASTLQSSGAADALATAVSNGTYGADSSAILEALLGSQNSSSTNPMLEALTGSNSNVLNAYLNQQLASAQNQNQALVDSFQKLPDSAKAAMGLDPSVPVTMEALQKIFGEDYGKNSSTIQPQKPSTNTGTTGSTATPNIPVNEKPVTTVTVVDGREYYSTEVKASQADKLTAESTLARTAIMRRGKMELRSMDEGPSERFYEMGATVGQVKVGSENITPKVLMQQIEAPIMAKAQMMHAQNETSSEFAIKLNPDGLGEIIVNMKNEGGKLSISMFAENSLTNKLLNTQLNNIRNNLIVQDVKVDFIEVRAGSEAFGGNFSGSFMQFGAGQNFANSQPDHRSAYGHAEPEPEVEQEVVLLPESDAIYI